MWQRSCCSSFHSLHCLALLPSIITGSWWALGLEREESARGAWTQGCSYSCTHFGRSLTACAVFWFLSLILVLGSTELVRNGQFLDADDARVGSGPADRQHDACRGAQSESFRTTGELSSIEAARVCKQMAQDVQLAGTCSSVVSCACMGQTAELWPKVACTTAGLTVPKKCAMDFSSHGKASLLAMMSFERGMQYYVQHMQHSRPIVNMVFCIYNTFFIPWHPSHSCHGSGCSGMGLLQVLVDADSCCVVTARDSSCHLGLF